MAAAALYAIKNNLSQLKIYHENEKIFAELLNKHGTFEVNLDQLETNIVMVNIKI